MTSRPPFPRSELPPGWETIPMCGSFVDPSWNYCIDPMDGQIAPLGTLSAEFSEDRATYVTNRAEVEAYLGTR